MCACAGGEEVALDGSRLLDDYLFTIYTCDIDQIIIELSLQFFKSFKFVRKVVIGDLRSGTLQEGTGFDEVIKQDLLPAVKAVHSWVPFSHQKLSNIKAFDFGAMQQQMSSQMKTCDK